MQLQIVLLLNYCVQQTGSHSEVKNFIFQFENLITDRYTDYYK